MSHAYRDFRELPLFTYGLIACDPPWKFETYSEKGEGRSPTQHYDCMSTEEIAAMPVGHLGSLDCALLLWGTSPMLPDVLEVGRAWGFRFIGKAFCWAKTNPNTPHGPADDPGTWFMGLGYHTRSNSEDCWLFVNGSPRRLDAGVRELIVAPRREHSRKPEEFYHRAERLYAGPRLDLFSRQTRPGWDSWGNETGKFDG